MIYFLRRTDGDIKIGTTVDYHMRLSQLIAQHGDLQLMGLMEGSYGVERELHMRFKVSRRGKSEFFEPTPALMQFINEATHLHIPLESEMTTVKVSDQTAHVIRVISSALGMTQGQVISEAVSHYFKSEVEAVQQIKAAGAQKQNDSTEN